MLLSVALVEPEIAWKYRPTDGVQRTCEAPAIVHDLSAHTRVVFYSAPAQRAGHAAGPGAPGPCAKGLFALGAALSMWSARSAGVGRPWQAPASQTQGQGCPPKPQYTSPRAVLKDDEIKCSRKQRAAQ